MWKMRENVVLARFLRFLAYLWKNLLFKTLETHTFNVCGKVTFSFILKGFFATQTLVESLRIYVDKLWESQK